MHKPIVEKSYKSRKNPSQGRTETLIDNLAPYKATVSKKTSKVIMCTPSYWNSTYTLKLPTIKSFIRSQKKKKHILMVFMNVK